MLGLGTWQFAVDTMLFKGDAKLVVGEKDGAYDVDVKIPGDSVPEFVFQGAKAEGNTLTGTVKIDMDMMKGKDIPFSFTFDGDNASGWLKVPFLGTVKLKKGFRVA